MHAVGIDLTRRAGLDGRVTHVRGDALTEPLPPASFDGVLSLLAVLHIPDRPRLLARPARLLRSGGGVYVEDLCERAPFEGVTVMAASVRKRRRAMAPLVACCLSMAAMSEAAGQTSQPPTRLANPASVRCAESGGSVRLERLPDGGQYGVCVFGDNRQCEEWALFRGDCPAGGLHVAGYVTAAARYCAITGGRYSVTADSGTAGEKGTCTLPGGKVCDAAAYYGATCSRERP